jgi:hypothetical protein
VVRYLAADSEDGRRYDVVNAHQPCLYHPADRAVGKEAAAAAGIRKPGADKFPPFPGELPAYWELVVNDATNVYQLPDGTFELFTAALLQVPPDDPRYFKHDNTPGWVRVIRRYRSDDGLNWIDRQQILQPTGEDPVDLQFYYLAATHLPDRRIGMLGHYRVGAQTMDLQWCESLDGINWRRAASPAWLPRSAPGELPDSFGIYAPHSMVFEGGRWHLFYTGTSDAHNHRSAHGTARRAVLHTTIDSLT